MINATCSAFRGKPSGSVSPSFATTVQTELKKTQELSTNKVGAVCSLLLKSGWPSGLRRHTQGGVPSSVEGFLVSEWRRGFESHFWHGLLTSSCNIQPHSEEVNA